MTQAHKIERLNLMGFALDDCDLKIATAQILSWLETAALAQPTKTVITLNPEIIVQAQTDQNLLAAINAADLVTADGVGIVWAVRRVLQRQLLGRATGVDLAVELMQQLGPKLSVYFLGAKPGVAETAAKNSAERFGIVVAGHQNGYFTENEEVKIVNDVQSSGAQLLLTALGAGRQEEFNMRWRDHLGASVAIGVGGTLDVLAGATERAPAWTSQLGLEWVWRITTMRRWARAKRLLDFVQMVLRFKQSSKH